MLRNSSMLRNSLTASALMELRRWAIERATYRMGAGWDTHQVITEARAMEEYVLGETTAPKKSGKK